MKPQFRTHDVVCQKYIISPHFLQNKHENNLYLFVLHTITKLTLSQNQNYILNTHFTSALIHTHTTLHSTFRKNTCMFLIFFGYSDVCACYVRGDRARGRRQNDWPNEMTVLLGHWGNFLLGNSRLSSREKFPGNLHGFGEIVSSCNEMAAWILLHVELFALKLKDVWSTETIHFVNSIL